MTQLRYLLVGLLMVLAQSALASGEARQWLERVNEAARRLNYEGTFVYRHQGHLETLRIIHRADEHGETERLYSLTGSRREILRDNDKITSIFGDSRAVLVDRRQGANPLAAIVPKDVGGLSAHYRLEMLGDGRIADRGARQIGIVPRDDLRYGYRLWIDEESGLLLRSDLLDESGEPIEQVIFTELLTPASINPDALRPGISGEGFTWYQPKPGTPPVALPEDRWAFNGLPPGFELVLREVRMLPGSNGPVEHLVFSDGLASVSVYVETADADELFTGTSRMGAVNAYGRVLGEHQITAVGEVPAATARRIAESMQAAAAAE
jgi:sigma-E factor negative regulatory protein RseB